MAADTSKIAALVTALKNKFVQRTEIFQNGVFHVENEKQNGTVTKIWNEEDGGGVQLIDGTSNIKAYTGVNEGGVMPGDNKIYVQTYAINNQTKQGARVTINENGAYYTKKNTYTFDDNDELLTKGALATEIDELELEDYNIAITTKQTPNQGALRTYEITQGGELIGEIDTPKDFLVKSGSVKTVGQNPSQAENAAGLSAGEKYISLVINTVEDDENETELIIPAEGLVEDTTYEADNTSLELSQDNVFSIKESYLEGEIEDYIDALTEAINDD